MQRSHVIGSLLVAGALIATQGALFAGGQTKPKDNSTKQDKPAHAAAATPDKPPADKLNVHGGATHTAKEHAFEVVFLKNGVHVYAYDMKGEPLIIDSVSGTVIMTPKKAGEKNHDLTLKANPAKDHARGFLAADTDLASIAKEAYTVKIAIKGLAGDKEKDVSFEVPFSGLSPEVHYACPKCSGQQADPGECGKCHVKLDKKVGVAPKT